MDLQIMSNSSSPCVSILQSDSTLDPFVYNLKSSHVQCSKNKYEVKAGSSWDFGKPNSFSIPRFGVLSGAVIKLPFVVAGVDGNGTNQVTPTLNLGNSALVRIALNSNSREIEQKLSLSNYCDVLELPLAQKSVLMDLAHNNENAAITSAQTINVYVPVNLSFFTQGMGNFLNAAFVESLDLQCELDTKANLFTLGGTGTVTFDAASASCLVYYLNMEENNVRRLEDLNYSIEKPLSMMCKSSYQEAAVTFAGTANTQTSVDVTFNCPNVITKTIFAIDKYKANNGNAVTGAIGDFQAIDKVEYYMSGRKVYEYTNPDEFRLENALFFNGGYGVLARDTASAQANSQNIYAHRWEISSEKNRFNGGVSGKGTSSFSMKIYFTPSSSGTYRVNCVQDYINIVSISGASGKIGVSMSL